MFGAYSFTSPLSSSEEEIKELTDKWLQGDSKVFFTGLSKTKPHTGKFNSLPINKTYSVVQSKPKSTTSTFGLPLFALVMWHFRLTAFSLKHRSKWLRWTCPLLKFFYITTQRIQPSWEPAYTDLISSVPLETRKHVSSNVTHNTKPPY